MKNNCHHLRERRLGSRRAYEGKVVKVDEDTVRLPNGREARREVVRHPGAVLIVPVLEDGRVVLIRQYRYAPDEVLWELPAGTLDRRAESAEACAQRELEEETGYRAEHWTFLTKFYTTPGFTDELMHCFLATGLTPAEQCPDTDEAMEVVLMPLTEALALAQGGEIRDGKTIAGLFLAAAHLGLGWPPSPLPT